MGVIGRLLAGDLMAGTPSPTDDFWYNPAGTMTDAGVRIDVDGAKKLSAWYRGRDILATVLAMLPLPLLERLPDDGGSQPAKNHPVYDILHDKPNAWQDTFQWRRQQMYHLIDHGNGVNLIVGGSRGFVHELRPIHPTLVTAEQVASGRIVYHVREPKTSQTTTYNQEQIFHLRGASDDGIWGKGILEYARGSLGTASATESYAANIFSKGTLNGGFIELPGSLNPEAARRLALSLVTKPGEHHLPKPLEQGAKFSSNTMTPEDAQMLLSRKYTVDDIARWLGVPRLMLENSDPSFGNAEQFTQNFIDFVMGPWLSLWEFAINDQLVVANRKYFARFTRQALVRGNFKERVDGLVAMVNAGLISVDEGRAVEDLNKRGGKADALREPQNITGKPAVPGSEPDADAPPKRQTELNPEDAPSRKKRGLRSEPTKAEAIVRESAARLLRKEVASVQAMAVKHAADEDAFAEAVTAWYAKHATLTAQTLQMSDEQAEDYCSQQAAQIVAGDWLAALDRWQAPHYAAGLAALALDSEAA